MDSALKFENEQMHQSVQDFKQLNDRLTDDYERMKNERDELLRRVRDAEQDAAAATVKATESGEKLLECEHAKQLLQEQVWKLELEARNLEGELDIARMRRDEFLAREQQRQMELERMKLERERELQQMERENEEHQAERIQWEQELEELTQQLRERDESRKEEIAQLRSEMEALAQLHEQEKLEWERERMGILEELRGAEERYQDSLARLESIDVDLLERLKLEKEAWEEEMMRLRDSYENQIEGLEREVSELRSSCTSLQEQKEQLINQIRDQHHSILTSLDLDRSELEQRHREELDGRLGPLMQELEEYKRKVRSLQRNMAFFLNKLNASRTLEKYYQNLQRNAEARAADRRKARKRENQMAGLSSLFHRVAAPTVSRYFRRWGEWAAEKRQLRNAMVEALLRKNQRKLAQDYWRKLGLFTNSSLEIRRHNKGLARQLEEVNRNREVAKRYMATWIRMVMDRRRIRDCQRIMDEQISMERKMAHQFSYSCSLEVANAHEAAAAASARAQSPVVVPVPVHVSHPVPVPIPYPSPPPQREEVVLTHCQTAHTPVGLEEVVRTSATSTTLPPLPPLHCPLPPPAFPPPPPPYPLTTMPSPPRSPVALTAPIGVARVRGEASSSSNVSSSHIGLALPPRGLSPYPQRGGASGGANAASMMQGASSYAHVESSHAAAASTHTAGNLGSPSNPARFVPPTSPPRFPPGPARPHHPHPASPAPPGLPPAALASPPRQFAPSGLEAWAMPPGSVSYTGGQQTGQSEQAMGGVQGQMLFTPSDSPGRATVTEVETRSVRYTQDSPPKRTHTHVNPPPPPTPPGASPARFSAASFS